MIHITNIISYDNGKGSLLKNEKADITLPSPKAVEELREQLQEQTKDTIYFIFKELKQ